MTKFLSAADAIRDQQSRQEFLEELYRQDGRHDAKHPMNGLYTGLFANTLYPQNHD